jgi:hypothetical protein
MHTKEQLMEMKFEQNEWLSKIKFYRDEIKQFNNHLGKVARPGAPHELLASVEHFQNQFIRQSEVLDIIRHEFKQHENLIEALESNYSEPHEGIQKLHTTQREKLDQFEKIFHDLRGEFNIFLNKVG